MTQGNTKYKKVSNPAVKSIGTQVHKESKLVNLDEGKIDKLLDFLNRRADAGIYKYFKQLASLSPRQRKIKNLYIVLKLSTRNKLTDALDDGLSPLEHRMLFQIERLVSLEQLALVHMLLDIELRNQFIQFLNEKVGPK